MRSEVDVSPWESLFAARTCSPGASSAGYRMSGRSASTAWGDMEDVEFNEVWKNNKH